MNCFALMLAPLALVANGHTQDLGRQVALNLPAMTADRALKQLSDTTGIRFEGAPETKGEVLLIQVRAMPLNRLMDRLAEVTCGEWRHEKWGYRLVRLASVDRAQSADEARRIAVELRKAIVAGTPPGLDSEITPSGAAAAGKQVQAAFDAAHHASENAYGALFQKAAQLQRSTSPRERALSGLLLAEDPATFAACPVGSTWTFSNRPTALQHRLSNAADGVLRKFVREENLYIAPLAHLTQEEARADEAAFLRSSAYRTPITEPVTADLQIIRSSLRHFNVRLCIMDSEGRFIDNAANSIVAPIRFDRTGVPQFDSWAAKRIGLTESSKELALCSGDPKRCHLKAGPFGDPAHDDPLRFTVQEGLQGIARELGADLVACLPDSLLQTTWSLGSSGELGLGAFASACGPDVTWHLDGGLLEVAPAFPALSRQTRCDRGPLSSFLARTRAKGYADLDDVARYSLEQSVEEGQVQDLWFFLNAVSGATGNLGAAETGSREACRFYGLLSPDQRRTLEAGGKLLVRDLAPAARAQLAARLFQRGGYVEWVDRPLDAQRRVRTNRVATRALPAGLPLDTAITMTVDSTPGVFLDHDGEVGRFMTCSSLGYSLSNKVSTDLDLMLRGVDLNTCKMRPGVARGLAFTLTYGPETKSYQYLFDESPDIAVEPVAWRSLPASYSSAIQRRFEEASKVGAPIRRADPPPPAKP